MKNKTISNEEEAYIATKINDRIDEIILFELGGLDEINCINIVGSVIVTFVSQSILCCEPNNKANHYKMLDSLFKCIKETIDLNLDIRQKTIN